MVTAAALAARGGHGADAARALKELGQFRSQTGFDHRAAAAFGRAQDDIEHGIGPQARLPGVGLGGADAAQGDLQFGRLPQGALEGDGKRQVIRRRRGLRGQGVGVKLNGVGQAGGGLDLLRGVVRRDIRRGAADESDEGERGNVPAARANQIVYGKFHF